MNVDQIRADMQAAADKALADLAQRVRTKLGDLEPCLFHALESIGATMDEHWHGEWDGPILFRDEKKQHRLIMVEQLDHDLFDAWFKEHPTFTDIELQDHGREALLRMCARPIKRPWGDA